MSLAALRRYCANPTLAEGLRLLRRVPSRAARAWHVQALRANHRRGAARARELPPEDADPTVIETGQRLRGELIASNAGKHAAAGHRVLMLQPGSITGEIWFSNLATCMRHAGIECREFHEQSPTAEINATLESFRPNVVIAAESPQAMDALDLQLLLKFKREHGCLRLFIPKIHSRAPWSPCPPADDERRRSLRARDLLADVYFSLFEPEFHEVFTRDPLGPRIEYVTIPQCCNPLTDYPLAATKAYDYLMAASLSDDRAQVSYRYLRPVLREYQGLWAGPGWGFGAERIAPADMPLQYARARVALSPLVGFVHTYGAELTHRVFAAAACGAFQLTMPSRITDRFFDPGELSQATTPAEYARLFAHYVGRAPERNAIALAGLRRVYSEHTCFHRIDSLVRHWEEWRRRGMF